MRWPLLLLIALLLAGCTHPPASPTSTSTGTSMKGVVGVSPQATGAVAARTLHFASDGKFTTTVPNAQKATRIAISAPLAAGASLGQSLWAATWPQDTHVVRGNFSLVLDLEGTAVAAGTGNTNGTACFWAFTLTLFPRDSTPGDQKGHAWTRCLWEPNVPASGLRTWKGSFEMPSDNYGKGWSLGASIIVDANVVTPGTTLELLTASTLYDSTLTFDGVDWT